MAPANRDCEERRAPYLWLQSFNTLDIALRLYRRIGFADAAAPPEMSVLGRTEVIMNRAVSVAARGPIDSRQAADPHRT